MGSYVHGYDSREAVRLEDQARTLEELLHADTSFPDGSTILEAGCGTGAQTVALARRSPQAHITSVDRSAVSLDEARGRIAMEGVGNVDFCQANIFDLPFAEGQFDHIFLCFVLEHLSDPGAALSALRPLLRRGGTITAIEGDHGSALFHPDSEAARAAIGCQVELQRRAGGDAMIGRRLQPLLAAAGFDPIRASPRMVYADVTRPELVEGFIRRTFVQMIEGVREPALAAGLIAPELFDAGVTALRRTAETGGVFCYTFFKAVGVSM
jgi:SAM-dependent methyltransferase